MPRFFVEPGMVADSFAVLTGEDANHCRVLRLGQGDEVTLCDGQGTDYHCVISDLSPGQVSLVVQAADLSRSEPGADITVYMAFAKADKFEHVVQKATELGASGIVAFPSARCVSRPDEKSLPKKLERWQKIAQAAAKQSGRGRVPTVSVLPSYVAALQAAAQADLPAFFYENAHGTTFRAALSSRSFRTASLVTGPEGGFEETEVAAAEEAGLIVCSLGTRILRCETAPLCALSALLYHCGEL